VRLCTETGRLNDPLQRPAPIWRPENRELQRISAVARSRAPFGVEALRRHVHLSRQPYACLAAHAAQEAGRSALRPF